MKQTTTLITILLLAISFSCEQKPKTTATEAKQETIEKPQKTTANPQQLVDSLKKEIGSNWVKQNPAFEPTQSSFFT
ncbi:hypothetical protein [Flavobacterium microcysteis]